MYKIFLKENDELMDISYDYTINSNGTDYFILLDEEETLYFKLQYEEIIKEIRYEHTY